MKIRSFASVLLLSLGVVVPAAQASDVSAALDPKTPCSKPEYPRSSLVNEEQGTVALALVINEAGSVVKSEVLKSTGFKNLDRAAENAFSKCKFKPMVKNGQPVQSNMKFEFVWSLG